MTTDARQRLCAILAEEWTFVYHTEGGETSVTEIVGVPQRTGEWRTVCLERKL